MKKYIILLCIAAITLASCTIEESQPVAPVQSQNGARLQLSGNSYVGTKVSIGEKDGDTYPLLWYTGDVISINSVYCSVDTLGFNGEIAKLYSETSGKASGLFQTDNELEAIEDMDLVILYPGSSLTYANGVITGNVPTTQNQRSASSSIHVGNSCFAYAETSIKAGQTEGISFDLQQKTAFVKVIVKKVEEYSNYNLYGATLIAEGAALAGDVTYDISTGEATYSNTTDYVGAVITNTAKMSDEESIYFTALPCDLTGTTCLLNILFTGDNDETVSVPVYVDGGQLKESCLTIIKVNSVESNAWYDPVETRDLYTTRWAYGPQNTYLIEQKASEENTLTIDVRARGNFSKVKEPKYYALLTGSSETAGSKLCYLPDGTNEIQDTPTNKVSDDCTITVKIYNQSEGDGVWAVVGIYDEGYELLWSFMIWRYLSGDNPKSVIYPNGLDRSIFLDRNVGASYSSNLAAEKGTFGNGQAYFQWGRKDPFMFTQIDNYGMADSDIEISVENSIKYPTKMFGTNWEKMETDLWGSEDYYAYGQGSSIPAGHKTIYDPCPEGYRTPDYDVVWDVNKDGSGNGEWWESELADYKSKTYAESPFNNAGESCVAYPLEDGKYDYWPYWGVLNSGSAWRSSANSKNIGAIYWSNKRYENSSHVTTPACVLQILYQGSNSPKTAENKSSYYGAAVRCQAE